VRVTRLLKRLLGLGRVRVVGVQLVEDGAATTVLVDVVLPPRRRLRCGRCGQRVAAVYDHRQRSWRHLDLGRCRTLVRGEVCRLSCPRCGVVNEEELGFARRGSRFTRAFEDTCAWLARAAAKRVVAELLRIDWATVGRIIDRVVTEYRERAGDGLDGLRRIGIDEVAYRKGHHYLLVVVDHDRGRVVWCAQGRSQAVVRQFFRDLGSDRTARLEAVSLDMSRAFNQVVGEAAPQAAICTDPFHLAAHAHFALDRVRAAEWQALRQNDPDQARWLKSTRWAVRRGPQLRTPADGDLLAQLAQANLGTYHAWLLCEQLRAVWQADAGTAAALLDDWCTAAHTSGLPPFVRVAAMVRRWRERILNSIHLGLSNARVEALNSSIRLLSHRSRGFRRVDHLISLIHLVCGRIPIQLPT
jgi:transposase